MDAIANIGTVNVIRWGGLLGVVVALLLLFGLLSLILGYILVGQAVYFVASLLLVFVLFAVYAAQADRAGALGLAGFVASTVGITLTAVNTFLWLPTLSGVAEGHAVIMFAWSTIYMIPFTVITLSVGLVLLGLATLRARVLPGWAGLLLAAGAAAYAVGELLLPVFAYAGILAFAIGFVGLGLALWVGTGNLAQQAGRTP
jgi:hypothetical protein